MKDNLFESDAVMVLTRQNCPTGYYERIENIQEAAQAIKELS